MVKTNKYTKNRQILKKVNYYKKMKQEGKQYYKKVNKYNKKVNKCYNKVNKLFAYLCVNVTYDYVHILKNTCTKLTQGL